MYVLDLRWPRLILATVVCLTCTHFVTASDEPALTKEQIKQFLLGGEEFLEFDTGENTGDPPQ